MSQRHALDLAAARAVMRRYRLIGAEPAEFDLAVNDAVYGCRGAHTLDRHGPDLALHRAAGVKTVEGRIYGDPPWSAKVTRSYQWTDLPTLNREVNEYVRLNWNVIRFDLANKQQHEGHCDAGNRVGRGYCNGGMFGAGPRQACYGETSQFKVRLRLVPDLDATVPFIVSAFPWG